MQLVDILVQEAIDEDARQHAQGRKSRVWLWLVGAMAIVGGLVLAWGLR